MHKAIAEAGKIAKMPGGAKVSVKSKIKIKPLSKGRSMKGSGR